MLEDLIAEHLKILRTSLDFSQEILAQKVGLTRQTINAIEKKRRKPSRVQALALYVVLSKSKLCKILLGEIDL